MDPISMERLQVHPEELNLNTGRIKIVSQVEEDVSHKVAQTQRLADLPKIREVERDTFTDLHRIWIPAIVFLAFILMGVSIYLSRQTIVTLEKRISVLEGQLIQAQKESQRDLALLKENLTRDKVPQSEIDSKIESLNGSLKELKTSQQAIQKKVDSLNLKEVLILEPEPATPAVPLVAPTTDKKP